MYIQRVIYDNSCSHNTERDSSALSTALYDLTKDFVYIIEEEMYSIDIKPQNDTPTQPNN